MTIHVAVALAVFIAAGAPAMAQVAVTVASNDEDVAQRDIAAAVVTMVRSHWQVSPPLPAARVKACPTGDTACLSELAAQAQATHLLVVGVAPLGVRDHVVAVQLFDVKSAAPLFEESTVQPGAVEAFSEVDALAGRLVAVAGPPALEPATAARVAELGALSWVGFGLVAAAGATAATSGIVGAALGEDREPANARNVFFYGLIASGALALAGSVALVIDEL